MRTRLWAGRARILLTSLVVALGGTLAGASIAAASGPTVQSPTMAAGPYFGGPVHECWSTGNESGSGAYLEEHSTTLGNCARGYTQLAVNELTPKFTLELNGAALACTADTAGAETALTCSTASSPSPTPSPSSSATSG